MIELVPNNNTRVELTIIQADSHRQPTAVAGLTVSAFVGDSASATAAIGSLSYTASEYLDLNAQSLGYYADVLGADIAAEILAATVVFDQEVFVRFVVGPTIIDGYVRAIIRQTRRLENA